MHDYLIDINKVIRDVGFKFNEGQTATEVFVTGKKTRKVSARLRFQSRLSLSSCKVL